MIKSGSIVAAILGLIWTGMHMSHVPHSDSLGITQVLMPLMFAMVWILFFGLLWTPCLLVAILTRGEATPERDIGRAWNIFAASLLPFAVCLCLFIVAIVKNHAFLP
jgi:hypothetical protein